MSTEFKHCQIAGFRRIVGVFMILGGYAAYCGKSSCLPTLRNSASVPLSRV